MRQMALALALLMVFAGCLGGSADSGDDDGDAAQPASLDESGANVTPVPANASENATYLRSTDYSQDHIHDYWGGQDARVLMDETVEVNALRSAFITAFWPLITGGDTKTAIGMTWFSLPNGTFVPEGAGKLTIEVDATGALKSGQQQIAYKAANTNEYVELDPQEAVASWTVELTPDMADLPHASSTRWDFRLEAVGNGGQLDGDVSVKITAERLFDIEAWPEHPDFWDLGNETRIDLVNTTGTFSYLQGRTFFADDMNEYETILLPAGTIVPPETEVLLVTFDYTLDGNAANNLNGDVMLTVKEGSSSSWYRGMWWEAIEREESADGGHIVYAILADQTSWDSPYGEESDWAWQVRAGLGTRDTAGMDFNINFGIAEVGSGEYTVDIKAFRVAPPWLQQAMEEQGIDDR